MKLKFLQILVLGTLIISCSKEAEDSDSKGLTTGYFIDSAVQGLEFKTSTQSGTTDANGKFSCVSGETIKFLINGIEVGSANCSSSLNPVKITNSTGFSDTKALNLAFLLQSMDSDTSDGINISSAKSSISSIDLTDDSAIDTIVSSMPNNSLTRTQAQNHMKAFSGNISKLQVSAACVDSASEEEYTGSCEEFSFAAAFDGNKLSINIDGYGKVSDTTANSPSKTISTANLTIGGVLNGGGRNTATGNTTMSSGDPMYFKDLEETSSSVCTMLGHSYVRHAIRITDFVLNPDSNSTTGKFAYTVTCDNNGTKSDYDEFWGTLAIEKQ